VHQNIFITNCKYIVFSPVVLIIYLNLIDKHEALLKLNSRAIFYLIKVIIHENIGNKSPKFKLDT